MLSGRFVVASLCVCYPAWLASMYAWRPRWRAVDVAFAILSGPFVSSGMALPTLRALEFARGTAEIHRVRETNCFLWKDMTHFDANRGVLVKDRMREGGGPDREDPRS